MQKIFLIGYMGSGKTTIGKCLAKRLNMQFIDLDTYIENKYRKSIVEIFADKGEDGFRKIEKEMLQEIILFEDVVISTGGGCPCFFNNMELMNNAGITIYLKMSVDELTKRLSGTSKEKRPLIKYKNANELKSFIIDSLAKRDFFYSQAIYVYNAELSRKDISYIVSDLIKTINGDT
ncbi:MAG: shikimate kinase [Dysgonamonadaceae bacterium]|jgi:shikimate kinase|nr:shikimate kinase [Dysgonamonadaceae bacterium]